MNEDLKPDYIGEALEQFTSDKIDYLLTTVQQEYFNSDGLLQGDAGDVFNLFYYIRKEFENRVQLHKGVE